MPRDWRMFLQDIAESCERIARYSQRMTRDTLTSDDQAYDAIVRNMEIIGEASKHIPPEICRLMPEVEWHGLAGLRDFLAHAYFGLDDDILWSVIQNEVPVISSSVQTFLASNNPSPPSSA